MGAESSIEWCDSSLNLQMGCDGCELWNKTVKKCYAGIQTRGRAGFKGWPKAFEEPTLFLDRLAPALKWKDLTNTGREDKPWMDKLPRIIFLNDMGDTFSSKLPLNWLAPLLPLMAQSRHQFLLLTKRPSRMREFSEAHPFPDNFWLGTTVTANNVMGRVAQLLECKGGRFKFLSVEPIWERIDPTCYAGMDWVIFGGESGDDPFHTCMDDIMWGVKDARKAGARVFVKQLGSKPYFLTTLTDPEDDLTPIRVPFTVQDSHGGDWGEWPGALQVREMPVIQPRELSLL